MSDGCTITDALATVCVGTPPLPDAGLDAMWAGAAVWVFIVGVVLAWLARPRRGHVSSGRAVHDLTPPPNLLPPGGVPRRGEQWEPTTPLPPVFAKVEPQTPPPAERCSCRCYCNLEEAQ